MEKLYSSSVDSLRRVESPKPVGASPPPGWPGAVPWGAPPCWPGSMALQHHPSLSPSSQVPSPGLVPKHHQTSCHLLSHQLCTKAMCRQLRGSHPSGDTPDNPFSWGLHPKEEAMSFPIPLDQSHPPPPQGSPSPGARAAAGAFTPRCVGMRGLLWVHGADCASAGVK